jgi:hypothetical protein
VVLSGAPGDRRADEPSDAPDRPSRAPLKRYDFHVASRHLENRPGRTPVLRKVGAVLWALNNIL